MAGTEPRTTYTDSRLWIAGIDAKIRPLKVELSGFYARDNARDHHTEQFELVHDSTPTPVFRRGLPFFFAVRFDRQFDSINDVIRLQFGFGECQQRRTSNKCDQFRKFVFRKFAAIPCSPLGLSFKNSLWITKHLSTGFVISCIIIHSNKSTNQMHQSLRFIARCSNATGPTDHDQRHCYHHVPTVNQRRLMQFISY